MTEPAPHLLEGEASAVAQGRRIDEVRRANRLSEDAFAASLETSKSSLRRYVRGDRAVPAEFITRLCVRYEIDPRWLLLGWGSAKSHLETPQPGAATEAVDLDLMREVIRALESFLDSERLRLSPEKKAEAAVTLYELIRAEQPASRGTIDISRYHNVIRLAR